MKRKILMTLAAVISVCASAQHNPVIARIGGVEVTLSELEYSFSKALSDGKIKNDNATGFLKTFLTNKMIAAEAERLGLDSSRVYRAKLASFRKTLSRDYFDKTFHVENRAKRYYENMKKKNSSEQLLVLCLFKELPQNMPAEELYRAKQQMDLLHNSLSHADKNEFIRAVNKFSDDKSMRWIGRLHVSEELEKAVFPLRTGEISRPFITPKGIGIARVMDRQSAPEYEEMKDVIIRNISRPSGNTTGRDLIKMFHMDYHEYSSAVFELLESGETDKTLFSIDGILYTGLDFKRFARSNYGSTKELFDAFLVKSVIDTENRRMETKYPEFGYAVKSVSDSLLTDIMITYEVNRKLNDERELNNYLKKNTKKQTGNEVHFDGIVLHCIDKKTASQAHKILKKKPREQWKNLIDLTFNTDIERVIIDSEGIFAPGDNEYVDRQIFRKGGFWPVDGFPVTQVIGSKIKEGAGKRKIPEADDSGYREYILSTFTKSLWEASEIDMEQVLKTVNNH